ncbi:MAG: nucleotidyltransferase family protein [Cyanobacteria bacterium P01_A01_bin.123]
MTTRTDSQLPVLMPKDQLAAFCQRHHIRKLSLFGSILRDDFTPESDIDFLVEFVSGTRVTYLDLAGMELELSDLLTGRKVDLRTPAELSPNFRQAVLDAAMVQYKQNAELQTIVAIEEVNQGD